MIMSLSAWAISMAKYVGTDDLLFGVMLSGHTAAVEGTRKVLHQLLLQCLFRYS